MLQPITKRICNLCKIILKNDINLVKLSNIQKTNLIQTKNFIQKKIV